MSGGQGSLEKHGDPTPVGPSTGGYAFDEATLTALVKKWTDLADSYLASTERVTTDPVTPPGLDFASKSQAEASTNAITAYREYAVKNYWYCIEQAQNLQRTLDDYLGQEHQTVIKFNKPQPRAGI